MPSPPKARPIASVDQGSSRRQGGDQSTTATMMSGQSSARGENVSPTKSRENVASGGTTQKAAKRRKHRKKRNRRPSFMMSAPTSSGNVSHDVATGASDQQTISAQNPQARGSLYTQGGNSSSTSLESEALLDHRYESIYKPKQKKKKKKST